MNNLKIGENLKKIRTEENMNQEEFAKIIGISRSYLSDLENNRKSPSIRTINDIARKINVSTEYLLGLSNFKNDESLFYPQNDEDEMFMTATDQMITFQKILYDSLRNINLEASTSYSELLFKNMISILNSNERIRKSEDFSEKKILEVLEIYRDIIRNISRINHHRSANTDEDKQKIFNLISQYMEYYNKD